MKVTDALRSRRKWKGNLKLCGVENAFNNCIGFIDAPVLKRKELESEGKLTPKGLLTTLESGMMESADGQARPNRAWHARVHRHR